MKKLITLTTMLVLTLELLSQNYVKLLNTSNKWNYLDFVMTTNGDGRTKTYSLFISGDTIINKIAYKKILCNIITVEGQSTVFAASMREDP